MFLSFNENADVSDLIPIDQNNVDQSHVDQSTVDQYAVAQADTYGLKPFFDEDLPKPPAVECDNGKVPLCCKGSLPFILGWLSPQDRTGCRWYVDESALETADTVHCHPDEISCCRPPNILHIAGECAPFTNEIKKVGPQGWANEWDQD